VGCSVGFWVGVALNGRARETLDRRSRLGCIWRGFISSAILFMGIIVFGESLFTVRLVASLRALSPEQVRRIEVRATSGDKRKQVVAEAEIRAIVEALSSSEPFIPNHQSPIREYDADVHLNDGLLRVRFGMWQRRPAGMVVTGRGGHLWQRAAHCYVPGLWIGEDDEGCVVIRKVAAHADGPPTSD